MANIKIITDSTASLPDDLVKKYDIRVVPQHIIWGTEDLKDMLDIQASAFYQRLTIDPVHPKTSQPPAAEFAEFIDAAKKDGAKEILICTVSNELSGTFASATQASEQAGIPVQVHDSRSVAMGLGWQVVAAARALEKGADLKGMAEAAGKVRDHQATVLALDTLEYLQKGGRIGGAARWALTALKLTPQLVVDPISGRVERGQMTRTRSKAIEAAWTACIAKMDTSKPLHIAVHHAQAPEDCRKLYERAKQTYPQAEVVMTELTPVIGVHGGPGTVALCACYDV